jgi:hypothetical protein
MHGRRGPLFPEPVAVRAAWVSTGIMIMLTLVWHFPLFGPTMLIGSARSADRLGFVSLSDSWLNPSLESAQH